MPNSRLVVSQMVVVGLLAGACTPAEGPGLLGSNMSSVFALDGTRTWDYVSTDTSLPYKLVARTEPSRGDAAAEEIPVRFEKVCLGNDPECVTGEWVGTYWWRYDSGLTLTEFDSAAGKQVFDPPLAFTTDRMARGESVETTTGGANWSSTQVTSEDCPSKWSVSVLAPCFNFELAGGPAPLAGTYWFVPEWFLASFEELGGTGRWQILRATYVEEDPQIPGETGLSEGE